MTSSRSSLSTSNRSSSPNSLNISAINENEVVFLSCFLIDYRYMENVLMRNASGQWQMWDPPWKFIICGSDLPLSCEQFVGEYFAYTHTYIHRGERFTYAQCIWTVCHAYSEVCPASGMVWKGGAKVNVFLYICLYIYINVHMYLQLFLLTSSTACFSYVLCKCIRLAGEIQNNSLLLCTE